MGYFNGNKVLSFVKTGGTSNLYLHNIHITGLEQDFPDNVVGIYFTFVCPKESFNNLNEFINYVDALYGNPRGNNDGWIPIQGYFSGIDTVSGTILQFTNVDEFLEFNILTQDRQIVYSYISYSEEDYSFTDYVVRT